MERLRIAFFCWESLHSVRVGGLAVAATNLAENLAKNHEIHFFTPALSGQEKDAEINGVFYHRCNPEGLDIIDYCRDMSGRMVKDYENEEKNGTFDILHFHDWHIADALERLKDQTTIFTYHSTEYGRSGNSHGEWREFKEISERERLAGLISKNVTTVSQTMKSEIRNLYGIPEWKINVVRNGIHPESYYRDIDAETVKQEYHIPTDVPLIFFAGRLTYQKGPDLLLGAVPGVLETHPDAHFIFAGDGDMNQQVRDRVSTFGQNAQFMGYLPDADFVKILNACDILAIPSRNEPFGLILLEGWSAEKCVVATDVGGLSENIDHYVDGVKVPVSSESLAQGIDLVMDDHAGMRDMGRMGKRKIEDEFSWNTIANQMQGEYLRSLN
jgi:glycogen synthase